MNQVCKRHGKPINPDSGHPTYALSDGASGYCQVCNVGHDTVPAHPLTERQLNVGAAYLAAIDTGRLVRKIPPLTEPEILALLAQIDQAQALEDTALFALRRFELDYFKKELRNADPYFVAAIKENLPWLFKEATS